jgi:hypothetical protein
MSGTQFHAVPAPEEILELMVEGHDSEVLRSILTIDPMLAGSSAGHLIGEMLDAGLKVVAAHPDALPELRTFGDKYAEAAFYDRTIYQRYRVAIGEPAK